MSKINVLSFEIANLIAAGEVVERPSSVLKELIENSIDAGASEIVAEIKRGGVSLIRVTDNGHGMEKEDLPISLKRHATSKIREKEDLDSIMTLGFRGEALAAISSVSELTIISRTENNEYGTMLTAEAGNIVDMSEVSASVGTTVVVENLFYNVPARRKFLKKDSTEAMNVVALVERVALSRPDISIQLLIDGEERFKTPGSCDLMGAIYSIFGKDFASKLIPAKGEANGIKVSGFIGRSDNVRKNRNLQNVFINGRYVKSLTAMAAIEKAYTSYIAPEAFPTCVLFLEMSPSVVDVNVHPAKLEVKFSDEKSVFEAVFYTVRNAIESYEYRPELTLKTKNTEYNPVGAFVPIGADTKGEQISINTRASEDLTVSPTSQDNLRNNTSGRNATPSFGNSLGDYLNNNRTNRNTTSYERGEVTFASPRPRLERTDTGAAPHRQSETVRLETMSPKDSIELLKRYHSAPVADSHKPETIAESQTKTEAETTTKPLNYKIIGEAFDCYVFVEFDGALLVVDKHAAHERVIFEDLKRIEMSDGGLITQELLLPISVSLDPDEISCANEFISDMSAVGFTYTVNGRNADITAIPNEVSADEAEELFIKMLDEIIDGRGNPEITDKERREKALYQIACKAAIKGGRRYDKAVIEWLISKLLLLPDITVCPHGRPVAYKLSKQELDRHFDRIK